MTFNQKLAAYEQHQERERSRDEERREDEEMNEHVAEPFRDVLNSFYRQPRRTL